jgi:hypothetical protein
MFGQLFDKKRPGKKEKNNLDQTEIPSVHRKSRIWMNVYGKKNLL